jgi:Protein of unknown function (DUF2975)
MNHHRGARYRKLYARLLRFYPRPYRERFAESMQQTFNDLCREQRAAGQGLLGFVLWTFIETSAAIIRENATSIMRSTMKRDSIQFLKLVKYSAITVAALMVAGIVTLMVISRGKGEDITGIVAPALLLTFVSSVVATVAAVFQKRAQKAIDINEEGLS